MVLLLATCALIAAAAPPRVGAPLRVCADPGNPPYSSEHQDGFENRIAEMIANNLNRPVQFVWTPERGNYLRKSLDAGTCDVVMSLPKESDDEAVSIPYYRSTYVFVTRADRPAIQSFDDPKLKTSRIGVNVIGHEGGSSPAAIILSDRGLGPQIRWYRLLVDYTTTASNSELLDAVENGDVDVAIMWGPNAENLAKTSKVPLRILPVHPSKVGKISLAFDISMGVRANDPELLSQLNSFISTNRPAIRRVLRQYGISESAAGIELTSAGK
jgi:mxaJ protein